MKKLISYCVPVKNRSEELKLTLPANLDANRSLEKLVEFVVVIFDEDDELWNYLHEAYPRYIESGALRLLRSKLDRWHFGRAKNSFREKIEGNLYSSLDADNFVTKDETLLALRLFDRYGERMLLHHFSGTWGDGTCGRVTLSADIYHSIGYDERFMPRQFDEFDIILSAIRRYPQLIYASHLPNGALMKCEALAAFASEENLAFRSVQVPDVRHLMPLNPKSSDYGRDAARLGIMSRFNESCCFAKNTKSSEKAEQYVRTMEEAANRLVDDLQPSDILDYFFQPTGKRPPAPAPDCVPVFACAQNEEHLLEAWYKHYRSLGCGPFFIIDDNSRKPVSDFLPHPDVYSLVPAFGYFRSCKAVWVRAAMKAFLQPGQWAVTVDVDEFIDIPSQLGDSIRSAIGSAEHMADEFAIGLLIDLLPDQGFELDGDIEDCVDHFDSHAMRLSRPDEDYGSDIRIKWGFGEHWLKSYAVDARFHLFGTIDVLRKVPLVKYHKSLMLNQGFHDIFSRKHPKGLGANCWSGRNIFPMRHYKLTKLFSPAHRAQLSERVSSSVADTIGVYHPTTHGNIQGMLKQNHHQLAKEIRSLPKVKYDADYLHEWLTSEVGERWPRRARRFFGIKNLFPFGFVDGARRGEALRG